ncbi:MAG: hypothetical protein ACRDTU_18760 [Micromonosporaceae bacterium]
MGCTEATPRAPPESGVGTPAAGVGTEGPEEINSGPADGSEPPDSANGTATGCPVGGCAPAAGYGDSGLAWPLNSGAGYAG